MIRQDNILLCSPHRISLIICCSHKNINISVNWLIYGSNENSQNSREKSRNTDRVWLPCKNMHASLIAISGVRWCSERPMVQSCIADTRLVSLFYKEKWINSSNYYPYTLIFHSALCEQKCNSNCMWSLQVVTQTLLSARQLLFFI